MFAIPTKAIARRVRGPLNLQAAPGIPSQLLSSSATVRVVWNFLSLALRTSDTLWIDEAKPLFAAFDRYFSMSRRSLHRLETVTWNYSESEYNDVP